MKLKHLAVAGMMVASGLLAGSCAFDEREVSLAIPGLGVAGGSAGGAGGLAATPRLAVGTTAIDLGWVTTNFSARARIRVDNLGTAPLPAPAVGFAEGSHADFSLIQNGCELEVAPGKSCELRVQLVPRDSGERAATLEVRSDVGGEARVALSGQGLAAGDLILAPVAGSFEDFGDRRVGSTAEETFSISNPSDVPSGPLRFRSNRPEFVLLEPGEGDCVPDQTSLVGGQSCTLRLAFTPSERGPLEATFTGASDGVGAVSVTLVGRGLLPATLSASAPAVDFAGVVVTSSAQRSVLFQNAGDEPLTLAGTRLAPETVEGFSILNSDCGAGTQIEGGASCSVQLEFRPPRLGEEFTAELVAEGAEAGQTQSVALRGIGLEQGALTVSAPAVGDDDFGEVLLGESSERLFQLQNPSAQSSGVLDIVLSEGFALAPPVEGAAGECVPGSTSLVDGEACTVRVLFTPSLRGLVTGSLTVSSQLAGATELPLTGRGIVPALLAVERELNFGRMLTGTSGVRTLTIGNEGDQPLPPPSFELTGMAPAQVAAFSLDSQCAAPLALGETCDLNLTFAPTDATAHAVTLNINSMGTNTSVLLLGEAQVPGSLVLSAADSVAFGDVPTGTTTSRAFVLANPGQVPSGRVTITSDNPRFATDLGDCNQGDPAGLVDGTSCTFNVRFTPTDNLPQAANLSVQSPGAGRAGLQLSGRGRQPALLDATGNRDLGRANVGQDAIREALNEFTWTVNNVGDLPTGALTVQNNNGAEFAIRNDSCSSSAVPGRGSCQMIIRFRPSAAGTRSARVVVTDPSGTPPATLAMTGLGVQLAGLGQSCVNAECSAGECTRGVCCNRACDRTCQVCSAQGQCIDQSSQEACGNGAACFGVDNCKLPAGRACSQNGGDLQCGSGQCERRLGGTGAGDRICCLDDCGNSLQCNGQNRCQAPTAGAGQACGAPGQLQCQTGLSCVDGVCCLEACGGYCERCQAGSGTCVAVPAGQQEADPVSGNNCTNGFECTGTRNGCRARTGQPCSSTDGSDCVSGNCEATAGGARVCCSQDCSGVRDSCRANGQGCVECVGPGECANGCNIDQGTCNPPGALGDACSNGAQCLNGRCVDGVCCNSACTGQCESCASAGNRGTCVAVTTPRTPCAGSGTTCGGRCDGFNRTSCVFPGTTTSCGGGPQCTDSTLTTSACNGGGTCAPSSSQCQFGCRGNACSPCRQKRSVNLLVNPGFDGSAAGWSLNGTNTFSSEDVDGCNGSGSVLVTNIQNAFSQCLNVAVSTGGVTLLYGFRFRGQLPRDIANCNLQVYADPNCTGDVVASGGVESAPQAGGVWARVTESLFVTSNAASAQLNCSGFAGFGNYDQFYLSLTTADF
jgi:hypothetical protein